MRKKIITFILMAVASITLLAGCGEQEQINYLNSQIEDLSNQKAELESSVAELKTLETAEKERTGTGVYVVVLNIKQSHFTLDLSEHIKDAMNDVDISVPVSEDFYNSVDIGDVIDDSFRMGSFIMKGSFGSWDITVKDKYIE